MGASRNGESVDVLIYDKVRWRRDELESSLLTPVRDALRARGLTFRELRYGYYQPNELKAALADCRAAIFLCEHETQGLAYQQMLASNVPVLAWDRGGPWQDPTYFPDRVQFSPVTSVPYWDDRCGDRFADVPEMESKLDSFLERVRSGQFAPRDYVLEHLTLDTCARRYVELARECGYQ